MRNSNNSGKRAMKMELLEPRLLMSGDSYQDVDTAWNAISVSSAQIVQNYAESSVLNQDLPSLADIVSGEELGISVSGLTSIEESEDANQNSTFLEIDGLSSNQQDGQVELWEQTNFIFSEFESFAIATHDNIDEAEVQFVTDMETELNFSNIQGTTISFDQFDFSNNILSYDFSFHSISTSNYQLSDLNDLLNLENVNFTETTLTIDNIQSTTRLKGSLSVSETPEASFTTSSNFEIIDTTLGAIVEEVPGTIEFGTLTLDEVVDSGAEEEYDVKFTLEYQADTNHDLNDILIVNSSTRLLYDLELRVDTGVEVIDSFLSTSQYELTSEDETSYTQMLSQLQGGVEFDAPSILEDFKGIISHLGDAIQEQILDVIEIESLDTSFISQFDIQEVLANALFDPSAPNSFVNEVIDSSGESKLTPAFSNLNDLEGLLSGWLRTGESVEYDSLTGILSFPIALNLPQLAQESGSLSGREVASFLTPIGGGDSSLPFAISNGGMIQIDLGVRFNVQPSGSSSDNSELESVKLNELVSFGGESGAYEEIVVFKPTSQLFEESPEGSETSFQINIGENSHILTIALPAPVSSPEHDINTYLTTIANRLNSDLTDEGVSGVLFSISDNNELVAYSSATNFSIQSVTDSKSHWEKVDILEESIVNYDSVVGSQSIFPTGILDYSGNNEIPVHLFAVEIAEDLPPVDVVVNANDTIDNKTFHDLVDDINKKLGEIQKEYEELALSLSFDGSSWNGIYCEYSDLEGFKIVRVGEAKNYKIVDLNVVELGIDDAQEEWYSIKLTDNFRIDPNVNNITLSFDNGEVNPLTVNLGSEVGFRYASKEFSPESTFHLVDLLKQSMLENYFDPFNPDEKPFTNIKLYVTDHNEIRFLSEKPIEIIFDDDNGVSFQEKNPTLSVEHSKVLSAPVSSLPTGRVSSDIVISISGQKPNGEIVDIELNVDALNTSNNNAISNGGDRILKTGDPIDTSTLYGDILSVIQNKIATVTDTDKLDLLNNIGLMTDVAQNQNKIGICYTGNELSNISVGVSQEGGVYSTLNTRGQIGTSWCWNATMETLLDDLYAKSEIDIDYSQYNIMKRALDSLGVEKLHSYIEWQQSLGTYYFDTAGLAQQILTEISSKTAQEDLELPVNVQNRMFEIPDDMKDLEVSIGDKKINLGDLQILPFVELFSRLSGIHENQWFAIQSNLGIGENNDYQEVIENKEPNLITEEIIKEKLDAGNTIAISTFENANDIVNDTIDVILKDFYFTHTANTTYVKATKQFNNLGEAEYVSEKLVPHTN